MTSADCLYRIAAERFDEGEFANALRAAHDGLRRDRYHPGLLQVYGLASFRLGNPPVALEALETASAVGPLDPLARLALAELHLLGGWRRSAAAALRFLAEPGRCPTPLLADLARLCGALGAHRAAFKVCRRLARLRSWYHPAHYGMAYYSAKLKRPPARVIRHLRVAHTLAPGVIPYRVALAGALADTGRAAEACDLVRPVPAEALGCPGCLGRLLRAATAAGDADLEARLRARLNDVRDRRCGGPSECFEA
ncbi:hypothetical protein R5W23_004856 [Gemmata sp. JC673]|uniref:Tetratricopeptide repeat protein n=1 Tax=Gemmata algarum TaxID=2975278 RepID=A0ABU5FC11_9BACT|nr:hypothetical protein [Gemmata algarum]MDY3563354.1 hypothetical protein [Gemmata algarum]